MNGEGIQVHMQKSWIGRCRKIWFAIFLICLVTIY